MSTTYDHSNILSCIDCGGIGWQCQTDGVSTLCETLERVSIGNCLRSKDNSRVRVRIGSLNTLSGYSLENCISISIVQE